MTTRTPWCGLVLTMLAMQASPAVGEVLKWTIDGEARRAVVFRPQADSPGGKAPLVLSFHGHGDNVENFQHTGLQRVWPEAIVVYFQGLPSRRDGLSGWQVEAGADRDRDLRLVDVALDTLRATFAVDDQRVYATGFSNGAGFTYLLWAERPALFAAFAPVAGRLRPSVQPSQPRPVLHIAGRVDRTVPFAAQQDAIAQAIRADHVDASGAPCGTGCTIFGAATASPVMTWVHPGGHEYPRGTSERIAQFLQEHSAARSARNSSPSTPTPR